MITLITPTGLRPEAFALCERSMRANFLDLGDSIQWIVIDDSPDSPTKCTLGQQVYFSSLEWAPGINTQRYNLDEALKHVRGDYIFIIEDDDYYHPEYLQRMLHALNTTSIVGLSNSRYYNLEIPGWREMDNFEHSSLCHTAFSAELLPVFRQAVHSGAFYIDMELWKAVKAQRISATLLSNTSLSVGMKGLPGRGGLGVGHTRKDYFLDNDHAKLKEWLGGDISHYLSYLKSEGLDADTQEQASSIRQSYRRVSKLR